MTIPTRLQGGMGFDAAFHDGHSKATLVAKYRVEIAAGKAAKAKAKRIKG